MTTCCSRVAASVKIVYDPQPTPQQIAGLAGAVITRVRGRSPGPAGPSHAGHDMGTLYPTKLSNEAMGMRHDSAATLVRTVIAGLILHATGPT